MSLACSTRLPGATLVVSPHLDDAVFGCGDVLADNPGSRVITIFSGRPTGYAVPTEWDRAGGFEPGQDVVSLRRREDRDALSLLRARPVWLPFLDRQYGPAPGIDDGRARDKRGERPR